MWFKVWYESMKQNETLLFYDKYFKEMGLDYMIFASTLLEIVREGKIQSPNGEIDLCVIGDDLTDEMIEKIRASGEFTTSSGCHEKIGETYFKGLGPAWVAVSPLWYKKGKCYINMINGECITMDKRNHDKSKWSTLDYIGHKFKCPPDPELWLSEWYGKDWRTPKQTTWHDNTNRIEWKYL